MNLNFIDNVSAIAPSSIGTGHQFYRVNDSVNVFVYRNLGDCVLAISGIGTKLELTPNNVFKAIDIESISDKEIGNMLFNKEN